MKTTTIYLVVKVEVRHEVDQDPNEIINECNYEFAIEPDEGKETPKILNTEILDIRDSCPSEL